jgi:2-polyprenyl-3-methyl-5-hydroxy-6-metoxy-1,4-benzoquinol methylase
MININNKYTRTNPSPRSLKLIEQYKELHNENKFKGISLNKHIQAIGDLIKQHKVKSLLDYGSGKGYLYSKNFKIVNPNLKEPLQKLWKIDKLKCYDPGYTEHAEYPTDIYDMVISTDVIEHVPEEDLTWFLNDIFSLSKKFVYLNIACYPALKHFKDGTNVHVSIFKPQEWIDFIMKLWKEKYKHLEIYLVSQYQEMKSVPVIIKKGNKKNA